MGKWWGGGGGGGGRTNRRRSEGGKKKELQELIGDENIDTCFNQVLIYCCITWNGQIAFEVKSNVLGMTTQYADTRERL